MGVEAKIGAKATIWSKIFGELFLVIDIKTFIICPLIAFTSILNLLILSIKRVFWDPIIINKKTNLNSKESKNCKDFEDLILEVEFRFLLNLKRY